MSWWETYLDNNDASCTDGFVGHGGEHRVGVVLKLSQVLLNVVELEDGPKGQIAVGIVHGRGEELQDGFIPCNSLLYELREEEEIGREYSALDYFYDYRIKGKEFQMICQRAFMFNINP